MAIAAKNFKKIEPKGELSRFDLMEDPEIHIEKNQTKILKNSSEKSFNPEASQVGTRHIKNLNAHSELANSVKLRIVNSPYARERADTSFEKTLPAANKILYKKIDVREFIFMVALPVSLVTFLMGARIAFVILTSPKISLPELIWKTIWVF